MWGDDADDLGDDRDTSWVNVAPGMAVEVSYLMRDFRLADDDGGELPAVLTGQVRIARDALRNADWGPDPVTGEKRN